VRDQAASYDTRTGSVDAMEPRARWSNTIVAVFGYSVRQMVHGSGTTDCDARR